MGGKEYFLIPFLVVGNSTVSWNMPLALTEFLDWTLSRRLTDLREADRWRLHVSMGAIGDGNGRMGLQYSVDNRVTWYGLDNGTVNVISTNKVSINQSSDSVVTDWARVTGAAKKPDVWLRIVGQGGNESETNYSWIAVEFK